jgi:hypothetical protein
LVCEDVRPEFGGKSTILGFLGIAPDVRIFLADFQSPVPRLAFLLIGWWPSEGAGNFDVELAFRISDEQGELIFDFPPTKGTLQLETQRFNVGISVLGAKFTHPGKYYATLLVNGNQHFQESFEVLPQPPSSKT